MSELINFVVDTVVCLLSESIGKNLNIYLNVVISHILNEASNEYTLLLKS